MFLVFLSILFLTVTSQYCTLPIEPHVQPHTFETYGPNGPLCGELQGWAMNHGCYINGTFCGQSCTPGNCYCIYACEPGYCMTQFNPAFDNIYDPSHGVLCQGNGEIKKVYSPNAPLCVPCASLNPLNLQQGLVTSGGHPSPAYFISTMSREVPVCGLMDPGVDDGLQLGVVSYSTPPLYAHMFPNWWYLPSIDSQIYIQVPNTSGNTSCVTKRNPSLPSPEGNAGFYQVVYTSGGSINQETDIDGNIYYQAYGQIAFFGDFGNDNNVNLAKCWKFLGENCVVNYGIRGYVCKQNQTVPNCRLDCELFYVITSASNQGQTVNWCRMMTVCNLATCPDPYTCLGPQDINGCSPVANLNLGETIVYQLFDVDPSFIVPDVANNGSGGVAVGLIIGVVVALIVLVVGGLFVFYIWRKKRQGGVYFWQVSAEETI